MASQPATRRDVDLDSTAVLAFDDGTRVPCDRFLLRLHSAVVRALLDDPSFVGCAVDARGRTVIPLPGQPSAPYWAAVDVMHGCRPLSGLGADEVPALARCFGFLGAAALDAALDAQLWASLRAAPTAGAGLAELVAHAPRLLRNDELAPHVVHRLVVARPMWADFSRDVLGPLGAHADPGVARALVAYAPNFFPPAMVVCWALDACDGLTRDASLRVVANHGVMYHPSELPSVLRHLVRLFERRGWADEPAATAGPDGVAGSTLVRLMRAFTDATQRFEHVPWIERGAVSGSLLRFSDVPLTSARVQLEAPRRARWSAQLASWLRVEAHADGRLDVAFRPRRLDDLPAGAAGLQLRVMCFDGEDPTRARCAESWHAFAVPADADEEDEMSLAHATSVAGDHPGVTAMLRAASARAMRLDFFYGAADARECPFDVAKCRSYLCALGA